MNNEYNIIPTEPQKTTVSAQRVFLMGVIAAVAMYFGVPGVVVGSIGLTWANTFMREHGGRIFKLAKVGRILSKVAIGVGIGVSVYQTASLIYHVWLRSTITYGILSNL